jgi:hypothetical protein
MRVSKEITWIGKNHRVDTFTNRVEISMKLNDRFGNVYWQLLEIELSYELEKCIREMVNELRGGNKYE